MRELYLTYRKREKVQPLVAQTGWTKNVLTHQIENQTYDKTFLGQSNFEESVPEGI
jgi:hypothetical protein